MWISCEQWSVVHLNFDERIHVTSISSRNKTVEIKALLRITYFVNTSKGFESFSYKMN